MQARSLRLGNLIGSIDFHNKISSRRKHQPVQQNNWNFNNSKEDQLFKLYCFYDFLQRVSHHQAP